MPKRADHTKEKFAPLKFTVGTRPGNADAHRKRRQQAWNWVLEYYLADRMSAVPQDPRAAIRDFNEWLTENRYRLEAPDRRAGTILK